MCSTYNGSPFYGIHIIIFEKENTMLFSSNACKYVSSPLLLIYCYSQVSFIYIVQYHKFAPRGVQCEHVQIVYFAAVLQAANSMCMLWFQDHGERQSLACVLFCSAPRTEPDWGSLVHSCRNVMFSFYGSIERKLRYSRAKWFATLFFIYSCQQQGQSHFSQQELRQEENPDVLLLGVRGLCLFMSIWCFFQDLQGEKNIHAWQVDVKVAIRQLALEQTLHPELIL